MEGKRRRKEERGGGRKRNEGREREVGRVEVRVGEGFGN